MWWGSVAHQFATTASHKSCLQHVIVATAASAAPRTDRSIESSSFGHNQHGAGGYPPCPPTIIISCDENILYYGHAYGGNWSIFPPIGSPSYRISLNFRRFFGDAFFSPDVRAKSATIGATRQRNGLLLNKTREQ